MHHVELGHAEGGRHLVLHNLHLHPLAHDILAVLQLADPSHVDAARRIELERPAAGGRFGATEHHADLLADLVDEDHGRFALGDGACELSHGLAHEPGLKADKRIADFTVEFLLRHKRRHGVDDDDVDRVRLDQQFGDLHRLFAARRLADQQAFQRDAKLLGPAGVEGMLSVDEGRNAARPLGCGDGMEGERGFAARLRPEHLDDATAGKALAAEGEVDREAAARDTLDRGLSVAAQRHDRARAEFLLDLGKRVFQRRIAVKKRRYRLDGPSLCVALACITLGFARLCCGLCRFGFL